MPITIGVVAAFTALALVVPTVVARAAGPAPLAAGAGGDLASHVDPMIGTFAPGFVFPGPSMPFGMVQNSPDTYGEFAYSGYLWTDPTIGGFSLVHLNGPGVKKAGDLPFMPVSGPMPPGDLASPYDHASESATPGSYSVTLGRYGTRVELTAGLRTGQQRYTFPSGPQAHVVMDVGRSVEGRHDGGLEVVGPDAVEGFAHGDYPVFFHARFSRPFDGFTAFSDRPGGYVTFADGGRVTMKVGISFVDVEGARRNLESEPASFDDAKAAAREAWNRELARVRVTSSASEGDLRTFYTALFHAQQHPNVFSDVDGRYRGYDGVIHAARGRVHYANFSSWDTYKAQNQLLATIQPGRYREMLLSLAAIYREGGKLPRWGEQNFDAGHMSGDPVIPMITDGVCRNLLDRPGDAAALADLYRGAVELADSHRPTSIHELGFLPDRPGTTLEYGVADFALALLAHALGHHDDATRFLEGSLRYRAVLDPTTRWVRPRQADGSWYSTIGSTYVPADEHGFQEGNSVQYSWLAPHDARGLFDRMGGDAVAVERLDRLFAGSPEVQNRATLFGIRYPVPQYAPGNEHDIQVPWMYAFAGQPWRAQAELRELEQVFRPTPDGLPGNDDLGSLSAWWVWNALGFGPVTPGAPFLVVGSPQFERVEVQVRDDPGAAPVVIEAPGTSDVTPYVQGGPSWFWAADLAPGARRELPMGPRPDRSSKEPPPSVSDTPLAGFGCRP